MLWAGTAKQRSDSGQDRLCIPAWGSSAGRSSHASLCGASGTQGAPGAASCGGGCLKTCHAAVRLACLLPKCGCTSCVRLIQGQLRPTPAAAAASEADSHCLKAGCLQSSASTGVACMQAGFLHCVHHAHQARHATVSKQQHSTCMPGALLQPARRLQPAILLLYSITCCGQHHVAGAHQKRSLTCTGGGAASCHQQ